LGEGEEYVKGAEVSLKFNLSLKKGAPRFTRDFISAQKIPPLHITHRNMELSLSWG